MRRSNRPRCHQALASRQFSGCRVDSCGFDRLGAAHGRQDAGQRSGHHGLSGARRAQHDHVVPASRSDHDRTLHCFLASNLGEVDRSLCRSQHRTQVRRRMWLELKQAIQQANDFREGSNAEGARARDGRLCRIFRGHDHRIEPLLAGKVGHRDAPPHRTDPPVAGQLAREHVSMQSRWGFVGPLLTDDPGRLEKGDRDRQVVDRPFLANMSGREVDHEPAVWKLVACVGQRGPHTLDRLPDRSVRQPNDRLLRECRLIEVNLNLARVCLDATHEK